ncbi:DUF2777 domain-containing protein [Alkalihalobacillus sp. MEB130]|uniref:DUF2777 family protein n=1 Tax=Alkalihalobacillus sp. MEB130 TaxID=2976704 RepID=UPI0028DFB8BC|nr:DUF2777 family protein [Alkalihalobacillus sp. MEB130]MDT8859944.1 DUF2777 domain-containing protein [Alkalihalobacillus sp. MEB130]
MDRKQAQSMIGKYVMIEKGDAGAYYGILQQIIAEPRTPWKGIVSIQGIVSLPILTEDESDSIIEQFSYEKGETVEFDGGKLTALLNDDIPSTFEESVIQASKKRHEEWDYEIEALKTKQALLIHFLSSSGYDLTMFSTPKKTFSDAVTYTFHHDGDRFILIDEEENRLDLEDCPFTVTWEVQNKTRSGTYEGNGVFVSDEGSRFHPKDGEMFKIDKEQFDPYYILRNELEPAALHSLEKNLDHFGVSHYDLIECHNSLLSQLLLAETEKSFKGVNFLTYKGSNGIILVQHHYERTLLHYKNDKIYDRFEFTTEHGKRAIATYTNEYSL